METRWKIQGLGNPPGYPNWQQYAIRDAKTNVHIATVGNVDRYFERNTKEHADLIAAAPELKAALHAALFFVPIGTNARETADAAINQAEGRV
jgi:hypothetical protein